MKKVLYVYRTARKPVFDKIKRNKEPDHQLYGLNYFNSHNYQTFFTDKAYSHFNLLHWFLLPIESFLIKKTSIGFKLDQAIILLPEIKRTDVIITTTDSVGLPILLLKKMRLINKPIIYISTGLINELKNRKKLTLTQWFFNLLKEANLIVCHSPIEVELFRKLIPELETKTMFVPFGIDISFFNSSNTREEFIFSVGRDRSRDFGLLADVARKIPNEQFVVVTSRSNLENITFSDNVKVFYDLPYEIVRDMYSKAKLVFIPLKEINRASGQISFLEALASKKKVVIASVKGIAESYSRLLKANQVCLYKPNNNVDAISKVKVSLKNESINNVKLNGYRSSDYGSFLSSLVEKVLSQ